MNYSLELTFPKAPGAAGTGLDSGHRVYYAYPGIPYSYVCAAVGGDPPFRYSVSGPSGMVMDPVRGILTWPNPTGTTSSVTVTVTDSVGRTDSATYTLTVDATKFRFVDASVVSAGNGILAAQGGTGALKTLADLQGQTTWGSLFVYFRSGTYDLTGVTFTTVDVTEDHTDWAQSAGRATTWMAYPGETATIAFGSDHTTPGGRKPCFLYAGDRIFIDGITWTDAFNKCLFMTRANGRGAQVTRNNFLRLGPGLASSNSSCIMFEHLTNNRSYNDVVAWNTVDTLGYTNAQTCFVKVYDTEKMYVAFNSGSNGLSATELVAYKDGAKQFFDYRNNFSTTEGAFGGNMHSLNYNLTYGEVWFSRYKGGNNFGAAQYAATFNQDSEAGAVTFTRCTFEGTVEARQVDSNDGPFTFTDCVLVNNFGASSPPGIEFYSPAASGSWTGTVDTSRVRITGGTTPATGQSLIGASGLSITDSNGLLSGSYRTSYLGTKGAEITTMAVTHVSASSNSTVGGTTIATTLTGVTVGNTILVQTFLTQSVVMAGSMVTDDKGHTYTLDAEYAAVPGDMAVFSTTVTTGGSITITFNPSATQRMAICAREVSGITRSGPIFDNGATGTSTTAVTTGVTPSVSGGIALAWVYSAAGGPSSWSNSFTGDQNQTNGRSFFAYKVTSSQAATTTTATFAGSITWYVDLMWYAGATTSTSLSAGDVTTQLTAWKDGLSAGDKNTVMRDALATAFGVTAPDLTTALSRYIGR